MQFNTDETDNHIGRTFSYQNFTVVKISADEYFWCVGYTSGNINLISSQYYIACEHRIYITLTTESVHQLQGLVVVSALTASHLYSCQYYTQ